MVAFEVGVFPEGPGIEEVEIVEAEVPEYVGVEGLVERVCGLAFVYIGLGRERFHVHDVPVVAAIIAGDPTCRQLLFLKLPEVGLGKQVLTILD